MVLLPHKYLCHDTKIYCKTMFFERKYYLERVRNAFADGKQMKEL